MIRLQQHKKAPLTAMKDSAIGPRINSLSLKNIKPKLKMKYKINDGFDLDTAELISRAGEATGKNCNWCILVLALTLEYL